MNYVLIAYQNIMSTRRAKPGRPRNPALDQAIQSAASDQLGEFGYARMSLESVAAAAGTTVPSLRRRHRNKAELVAAVIGSLRVEEPPADGPTPRAHALAILENLHSNLRSIPAMAILGSLLVEEGRHPELLHLFKTRIVEPRRALLRQALEAGGLPDTADLDALTSMLIGSFYGRYLTVAGLPDDWPDRVLAAVWPPDTDPDSDSDTAPAPAPKPAHHDDGT
jgi:AcrR family transcriptional regulator